MTDKGKYIDEIIINSLKSLLAGRVNELLGETEYPIPPIEFGAYTGALAISPVIALSVCERTEKERIIRQDVYTLDIGFTIPESPDGELFCYACAYAVDRALRKDPALGGAVNRAGLTDRKYNPPKCSGTGERWELVLSLQVTVEEMTNAD